MFGKRMLKQPPAGKIGTDHSMEGAKRRGKPHGCKGRETSLNPGRIQEYDFFVTPDQGEGMEAVPADRRETVKKRGSRNKCTTFFLSD